MDDLSTLIPIRRGGESERVATRPVPASEAGWTPREPETPWRLAVVEAWFARARQAGLDTIEQRRRARRVRER